MFAFRTDRLIDDLERGARVGPGAVVGGQGGDDPALVGEQAQVPEAATVKPGGRFS